MRPESHTLIIATRNKMLDSETIGSTLSIGRVDIEDAGLRKCNDIQRRQFSRRSGVETLSRQTCHFCWVAGLLSAMSEAWTEQNR